MSDPFPHGAALRVSLNGTRVGTLVRRGEGSLFFLEEAYLELASRPVLGQVFEDAPRARHGVAQGVPRWFANLLPEGPLRTLIAERAGVDEARAFFLIALLGEDLPGAVVVAPEEDRIVDAVGEEFAEMTRADEELWKFSLAGVQLKFSAVRHASGGLTIPTQGVGGDWIVKLPSERFGGIPEAEYSMLKLASAAGVETPDVELIETSHVDGLPADVATLGTHSLAVRRFDREGDKRVHIEDFAQVFNLWPFEKYGRVNYETMARVLAAVTADAADVDRFVQRLVFIIIIGDGDSHIKNWSLIYRDPTTPTLAPAYDLLPTFAFIAAEYDRTETLGLNLGGNKSLDDISERRLVRFARRAGLDEERVLAASSNQMRATAEAWESMRGDLPLADAIREALDTRFQRLPLTART